MTEACVEDHGTSFFRGSDWLALNREEEPFDRLRANGDGGLASLSSVRAELVEALFSETRPRSPSTGERKEECATRRGLLCSVRAELVEALREPRW